MWSLVTVWPEITYIAEQLQLMNRKLQCKIVYVDLDCESLNLAHLLSTRASEHNHIRDILPRASCSLWATSLSSLA
jgi:hypothetical protein